MNFEDCCSDNANVALQSKALHHALTTGILPAAVLDRTKPQQFFRAAGRRVRTGNAAAVGGFQLGGLAFSLDMVQSLLDRCVIACFGSRRDLCGHGIQIDDYLSPRNHRWPPQRYLQVPRAILDLLLAAVVSVIKQKCASNTARNAVIPAGQSGIIQFGSSDRHRQSPGGLTNSVRNTSMLPISCCSSSKITTAAS
jgi:hypothetical protein